MACNNCNKKKDQSYVEAMAQKMADATGQPQQVFIETTWHGDIFDFEPLGIKRENIVRIVKVGEGQYMAISIQEQ